MKSTNQSSDAVSSATEAIDTSFELVADHGRVATLANNGRGIKEGFKVLGGGPNRDPGTEIRAQARLDLIGEFEAGRLQIFRKRR